MDKELEDNYSEILRRQQQQAAGSENSVEMVDYMLGNHHPSAAPQQHQLSLDKLSFADVMQFADFGPKLALNQPRPPPSTAVNMPACEDDSYFFKFNFMNDRAMHLQEGPLDVSSLHPPPLPPLPPQQQQQGLEDGEEDEGAQFSENASSVQQLGFGGGDGGIKICGEVKNRRKRPRSVKTSEEVESQRMTHIAVERNRRRQMNDHLRVLRSLMPGSYVQRGDQASIIGGAIEFVRELEQLLQCLESQKRRRLFGGSEPPRNMADGAPAAIPIQQQSQQQPLIFPPLPLPCELDPGGLREDTAESKSCLGDVEVRVLGHDALIKVLSRRRPGQLIKTIAALEDMQFAILHTNITTIEQTVLYSFNVKVTSEARCSAEDIASSVQQILSFIDSNAI